MPFNQSAAVVERSLREFVRHLWPQPRPRPGGVPAGRSFRGWLLRRVAPAFLGAAAAALMVVALVAIWKDIFIPDRHCEYQDPGGSRGEYILALDDPFTFSDDVLVCYPGVPRSAPDRR